MKKLFVFGMLVPFLALGQDFLWERACPTFSEAFGKLNPHGRENLMAMCLGQGSIDETIECVRGILEFPPGCELAVDDILSRGIEKMRPPQPPQPPPQLYGGEGHELYDEEIHIIDSRRFRERMRGRLNLGPISRLEPELYGEYLENKYSLSEEEAQALLDCMEEGEIPPKECVESTISERDEVPL